VKTDHTSLRDRLLERRIDALKDAVNRTRTTWLFATLLAFVLAAAIFNATLGYATKQVIRRAQIVAAVNKDWPGLQDATKKGPDAPLLKTVLIDKAGGLGYLGYLMPESNDEAKLKALREAAAFELQQLVTRKTSFDTVQIPLVGVSIAASDVGIVGGVGLAIVGFWLLAMSRRENHAFGEFIRKSGGTGAFTTKHLGYSPEESAYAYHAISQYMVFCVSSTQSLMNPVTLVGFLLPPAIILLNHLATAVMLIESPGLGGYFQWHVLVEGAVMLLVFSVWGKALLYQINTTYAFQAWRGEVDDYETKPPK
jgi:hypothetical protein